MASKKKNDIDTLSISLKNLDITDNVDSKHTKKKESNNESTKKRKELNNDSRKSKKQTTEENSPKASKKIDKKGSNEKKKDEIVLKDLTKKDLNEIDKKFLLSGMFDNLSKKEIGTEIKQEKKEIGFERNKSLFIIPKCVSDKFYCAHDGCLIDDKCQFPNGLNIVIDRIRPHIYTVVGQTTYMESKEKTESEIPKIYKSYLLQSEISKRVCKNKGCMFYANIKTGFCTIHTKKKNDEKKDEKKDETDIISKLDTTDKYVCLTTKVCSLNCMKAYFKKDTNPIFKKALYIFPGVVKALTGVYPIKHGFDIKESPSKNLIDVYGGHLTINEYRKLLNETYDIIDTKQFAKSEKERKKLSTIIEKGLIDTDLKKVMYNSMYSIAFK